MTDLERELNRKRFFECRNKKQYSTPQEAEYAAKVNRQRAYQCDWCKKWHLTSKPL